MVGGSAVAAPAYETALGLLVAHRHVQQALSPVMAMHQATRSGSVAPWRRSASKTVSHKRDFDLGEVPGAERLIVLAEPVGDLRDRRAGDE